MTVDPVDRNRVRTVRTALGDVECRTIGQGPPVLVVHGTPGGIDQAEIMSRFLPRTHFTTVLLSRPGYLGTPLADLTSWDAQGDLLAAVLDALALDRAGVLAWSGGGPPSYRFAARHPDRVTALVAAAAVSTRLKSVRQSLAARLVLDTRLGDAGVRMAAALSPRTVVAVGLDSVGGLNRSQRRQATDMVMADPVKRHFVVDVARTTSQTGSRKAGSRNDHDRFDDIISLDLAQVRCPVLLVHGTGDTAVPITHSRLAHRELPRSDLITLEHGTHLAFYTHPGSTNAQRRAIDLLRAGP